MNDRRVCLRDSDRPLVVFLMGPTASGKTDLAIALHEQLPMDIVSVDSALVYRGLDIGSAKPDAAELTRAPHRLLDIRDPADPYSAADFREDALREIGAIHAAGRIPLLVGGTMMYFKALLEGFADMPPADAAVRAAIEAEAGRHGWPWVHQQLASVDPESAAQIHPNHSQRLSRALEVYRVSGETMTALRQRQERQGQDLRQRYRVLQVAIMPHQRKVLHERIERRFRRMLEQGFVAEVEALHRRPDLHRELPAIRAVGYRQVWEYLDGDCSYEEMVARGIAATRQLAKRQLTWLRGWPELYTIYTDNDAGQNRQNFELLNDFLNFLPKEPL